MGATVDIRGVARAFARTRVRDGADAGADDVCVELLHARAKDGVAFKRGCGVPF